MYDAGEIGELLHQKQVTIRRKITAGEFGDVVKVGRSKLVTEDGLKGYIAAHTGPAADCPVTAAWQHRTRRASADVYARI